MADIPGDLDASTSGRTEADRCNEEDCFEDIFMLPPPPKKAEGVGRKLGPLWAYFDRGDQKNSSHYYAICKACAKKGQFQTHFGLPHFGLPPGLP